MTNPLNRNRREVSLAGPGTSPPGRFVGPSRGYGYPSVSLREPAPLEGEH